MTYELFPATAIPRVERYLTRIASAAVLVARGPALKRPDSKPANAMVPWEEITRLRAVLTEAGIDWKRGLEPN